MISESKIQDLLIGLSESELQQITKEIACLERDYWDDPVMLEQFVVSAINTHKIGIAATQRAQKNFSQWIEAVLRGDFDKYL